MFWLSLVSESTQWNIFAYNLEKNICLPPQECIHWLLTNIFYSFIHFKYKKGLIYTLVDRIFKIKRKTTSGVKQDFKNLSNALQFNSIPSYLIDKIIIIIGVVIYKTCFAATSMKTKVLIGWYFTGIFGDDLLVFPSV